MEIFVLVGLLFCDIALLVLLLLYSLYPYLLRSRHKSRSKIIPIPVKNRPLVARPHRHSLRGLIFITLQPLLLLVPVTQAQGDGVLVVAGVRFWFQGEEVSGAVFFWGFWG